MSNIISLCGLWASKDKNGNPMMSGKITYSAKIYVFKNTSKKKESDPDYFLKLAAIEKDDTITDSKTEELPF